MICILQKSECWVKSQGCLRIRTHPRAAAVLGKQCVRLHSLACAHFRHFAPCAEFLNLHIVFPVVPTVPGRVCFRVTGSREQHGGGCAFLLQWRGRGPLTGLSRPNTWARASFSVGYSPVSPHSPHTLSFCSYPLRIMWSKLAQWGKEGCRDDTR